MSKCQCKFVSSNTRSFLSADLPTTNRYQFHKTNHQALINRFHLQSRRITGHLKRHLHKRRTTETMGVIHINTQRVTLLLRRMYIMG